MPSTRALIHAPWSASKVATALRCPRLFHFKYVEKIAEPEPMPEARIGKAIHVALEHALQGTPPAEAAIKARAVLTDEHEQARYDTLTGGIGPFTERINRFRRQRRVQRQVVEFALAVREDLTSTAFYSGDAYYRGIIDAAYLYDEHHLAIVDHKTGVRLPPVMMRDQLDGYLVLSAAWWRSARTFWLGLHWVTSRSVEWSPPVTIGEVSDRLGPNLLDNIEAAALAVDDGPRTNPGTYCDRCAYRKLCPASQERWEPVDYDDDED